MLPSEIVPSTSVEICPPQVLPRTSKLENVGSQAPAADVAETLSSANSDIKLYQSSLH